MDRVDNIMERLGFKKDAEDSIKAAFLKNLMKQAYGVDVPVPPQYQAPPPQPKLEDLSADILAGRPLPEKSQPERCQLDKPLYCNKRGAQEERQLSFNFVSSGIGGAPANQQKIEEEEPPKVG